jgi:hypothetical protein
LQRAFSNLGHQCDVWGNLHFNFNEIPDFNSYDIIIDLEAYFPQWIPYHLISQAKNPKKYLWSIDAHVTGTECFEDRFKQGSFDVLLHSTIDYVVDSHHRWFPNAYDSFLIDKKPEIEKKYKIGYCGSVGPPHRKELLELIEKEWNAKLDIWVLGDEMVRAINSYSIHFNKNILNDLNYRNFETIGCGTLLLSDRNEQHNLLGFVDNVNCLLYNDKEELLSKVRSIINDSERIKEISDAGYKLAKNHTYIQRAKNLVDGDYKHYEK